MMPCLPVVCSTTRAIAAAALNRFRSSDAATLQPLRLHHFQSLCIISWPQSFILPTFYGSRSFSTSTSIEEDNGKESNRAAFRATPVIPSILAYIKKIGVGISPKKSTPLRRRAALKGKSDRSNADTFNAFEEKEYFARSETRHRLQSGRSPKSTKQTIKKSITGKQVSENKGAYWLPPPPFSSYVKGDIDARNNCRKHHGQRIIRRPVKCLGKAGSLSHELPRETVGLAEVAIAGRSNVGKSTLLNALLYGNTDENLTPRQYQRGGTPDRTKLPKGVKAEASSKPGQTKELSFYQLTADILMDDDCNDVDKAIGKMSLLLVDLPGYGFAFAKEEKTIEWRNLMHHYLLERRSLKRILLLLDARHGFKKADFDFLGELQDGLMAKVLDKKAKRELPPIQIVLTKCDLVPQIELARRVVIVRKQLSDFLIREPSSLPVALVSARAGVGYNNLRKDTPMGGVLELQREIASLVPTPRYHGKNSV